MTEQLVFELAAAEPPSFANFLTGRNGEALASLRTMAAGGLAESGVVLWGEPGAGKTHLLRATASAVTARGAAAAYVTEPGALFAHDLDWLASRSLVAVDAIESASTDAQARLFTLYNRLRDAGGHLLVASPRPPGVLALRDDLRSRFGWGLVYEVLPLADSAKPAALALYAEQRGFRLSDDVIAYLLAHVRRDMPALLSALAALDRHSLATKRPITVPMLRAWLQREIKLDR